MAVAAVALLAGWGLAQMSIPARANTAANTTANTAAGRVYELRTYTSHPGRLAALNARFKNHTIPLFEKHGIQNHEYWIPTDEKQKENTLIYVVSHESMEAARKNWASFVADPEWREVAKESEKDGPIVEKMTAVYMTLTDYSPVPAK
jgi:hypothetical protein